MDPVRSEALHGLKSVTSALRLSERGTPHRKPDWPSSLELKFEAFWCAGKYFIKDKICQFTGSELDF